MVEMQNYSFQMGSLLNPGGQVVILGGMICPPALVWIGLTELPNPGEQQPSPPEHIVATALECNPTYPKLYRRPCLSLSILVQVICDAITH